MCVLVGACAADRPGSAQVTISDSAGVRLIENRRPSWQAGEAWRISSSPDLLIGEPAVSAAEQFTRITGLLTLPDGRIVVANEANPPELRIFGPDGGHRQTVGREGQGPGEFLFISRLWFAPPDTLVTFDSGRLQVAFFGTDGDYRGEVRMELRPGEDPDGRLFFGGRFADGTYLFLPTAPFPSRGVQGSGRKSLAAVRARADATVVDTIGVFPDLDWMVLSTGTVTSPLFGKQAAYLVHDSDYYTGIGDDFVIDHYDLSGHHVRRIRREFEPRALTDEAFEQEIAEVLTRIPSARHARARRFLDERSLPGSVPAYGRQWRIDAEGHLWIPEYPVPGDAVTTWSVFDPEGRWLGVVEMPPAFEPREIGADYVLGVWKDELDVETVRRYKLIKPGGGT